MGEAEVADITRRAAGERLASIAKSYAVDVSMISPPATVPASPVNHTQPAMSGHWGEPVDVQTGTGAPGDCAFVVLSHARLQYLFDRVATAWLAEELAARHRQGAPAMARRGPARPTRTRRRVTLFKRARYRAAVGDAQRPAQSEVTLSRNLTT